jgi:zinc D-Ala-D-Ala dipeptidase
MRVTGALVMAILLFTGGLLVQAETEPQPVMPSEFVYLREMAPGIRQDIRYAGADNFTGRPVHGYFAPECILTRNAATALARVQADLEKDGLGLKVYDCYRPQRSVSAFVTWAKNLTDEVMKHWLYPNVPKDKLFAWGYIAEKSGHSRGSTVDLTLIPLDSQQVLHFPLPAYRTGDCTQENFHIRDESLPMGTAFDCFDELSHTDNPEISEKHAQNRQWLKSVMERHGFKNLPEEWWHYTLKEEPFPNRYFDFPIR